MAKKHKRSKVKVRKKDALKHSDYRCVDPWSRRLRGLWKIVYTILALFVGGGGILFCFKGCNSQHVVNSPDAEQVQITGSNNAVKERTVFHGENFHGGILVQVNGNYIENLNCGLGRTENSEVHTRKDGKVSSESVVGGMEEVVGLSKLAYAAWAARCKRDISHAVELASTGHMMATNAVNAFIGKRNLIQNDFLVKYSMCNMILAEDALQRREYKTVVELCEEAYRIMDNRHMPYFAALHSVAELRLKGDRMVFFSSADLVEMVAEWRREDLISYLKYLMEWGYLPFEQVQSKTGRLMHFPYFQAFGIPRDSNILKKCVCTYSLSAVAVNGKPIVSNEISYQWTGLDSYEWFDVTEWRLKVEGMPVEKREELPIKLNKAEFVHVTEGDDVKRKIAFYPVANPDYHGADVFDINRTRIDVIEHKRWDFPDIKFL